MAELLKVMRYKKNNKTGEYLEDAPPADEICERLKILTNLKVDITRVCTVNNNYMEIMYELKKEEYRSRYGSAEEQILYHATSEFSVDSIIKNNFDWRMVSRSKYGVGVSFSNDPDYANYYSNMKNGTARAYIVAKVLTSGLFLGTWFTQVPPENKATSISINGKVIVKFNDNEFLPLYVVYYNAPDRTRSKHYRPRLGRRFYF